MRFGPQQRPIDRLLMPIQVFAKHKLAGAGLLMLASAVALVWANSPWEHSYHELLETPMSVSLREQPLSKSLHHWINDGLMGVFFFLVGLEIKRELLAGELSTVRKALLPAIAAAGGMIGPALVYYALNAGGPAQAGWGIPMATDIAFALGVLALLGDRVPIGVKVFLTALAIVDDIGAVLVIAIFYTTNLSWLALGAGAVCVGIAIIMNMLGARNPATYLIVGICAWLAFLESGVHATVAALLMAFTIPARTRIDGKDFLARLTILTEKLRALGPPTDTAMNSPKQQHLFEQMNECIDHASAPLQRIEHALAGPVTFLVLPVFALANAGVTVRGSITETLATSLSMGIVFGLVGGKVLGVSLAAWIAVRFGLADLPKDVTWGHIIGCGMLAGIGFTMALFVAELAFDDTSQIEASKIAIMTASLFAAVIGYFIMRRASRRQ